VLWWSPLAGGNQMITGVRIARVKLPRPLCQSREPIKRRGWDSTTEGSLQRFGRSLSTTAATSLCVHGRQGEGAIWSYDRQAAAIERFPLPPLACSPLGAFGPFPTHPELRGAAAATPLPLKQARVKTQQFAAPAITRF